MQTAMYRGPAWMRIIFAAIECYEQTCIFLMIGVKAWEMYEGMMCSPL